MSAPSENSLVIADRTFMVWSTRAFGVLFTALPALLAGLVLFDTVFGTARNGTFLVIFGVLVLATVALFGSTLLLAEHQHSTFDRSARQVTIHATRPGRQSTLTIPFADVRTVGVVGVGAPRRRPQARPMLLLTDGREVSTIGVTMDRKEAHSAVAQIAAFTSLPVAEPRAS